MRGRQLSADNHAKTQTCVLPVHLWQQSVTHRHLRYVQMDGPSIRRPTLYVHVRTYVRMPYVLLARVLLEYSSVNKNGTEAGVIETGDHNPRDGV